MAFDSKTQALAEKAKIPQKSIDWFISMDCTDCEGQQVLTARLPSNLEELLSAERSESDLD